MPRFTPLAALLGGIVLAGAASAAEINVYTYRQPYLVKPVFEAFTKETGIKVNTLFASSGLEERIRAEGANSPADLLLVEDVGRLANAVDLGIAQEVRSDVLERVVPPALRDPEGRWFALTQRARVVYASRERVPDPPKTYENLADPRWKGRICIRSGQHAYNITLIAAMIAHRGTEAAADWLKGVKANLARKPSGSDRDVAKDIAAGVCDIGLGNTYYMGGLLNEPDPARRAWGEAVRVVFPAFEGGGTHMNVSGAIVAKHAPHRAEALKFLEFMVGEKAQELYADADYEYPVRAGVAINPTVEGFGTVTPDDVPLARIATNRKEASEIVDRVGFDH